MTALGSRRPRPERRAFDRDRRTVVLIRVLLGFEAVLYSALTPILPHYANAFGASKPAIGVLAASYPAGMIPGSLLGAWIATRAGVRRTTVVGLLLFTGSIVAFGFGSNIIGLDGLRFVQGMACGCVWAGGLAWVIAISPRERRGEMLGSVLASAIFGTLVGPVLGTVAVAAGTEVVFACVGGVSLALTAWTLEHPEPPRAALGAGAPLRVLARDPRIALGCWLILLEACTIGAAGTLLPLRLSSFGASGVAIGVTFVLASLLSLLVNPAIGRVVDRRGVRLPLSAGLGAMAVLLALLPLPAIAAVAGGADRARARRTADRVRDAGNLDHDGRDRADRRRARVRLDAVQPGVGDRGDDRRAGGGEPVPGDERCRAAGDPGGSDAGDARARAAVAIARAQASPRLGRAAAAEAGDQLDAGNPLVTSSS